MKIAVRESAALVVNELSHATADIDWAPWEGLPGLIARADVIFAIGNGRSGLALRMAAMRFMHLGKAVHVVGETTTPAIQAANLLLAVSGSGKTDTVIRAAEVAANRGAVVAAITAGAESPLAQVAGHVLLIPAAEKTDRSGGKSGQYAGTLFEQVTLVLLDAVFHTLWLDSGASADQMYLRHANLG
ncbi:MAG: 6-phospho-3-hexuloisomerase [Trebonia sp.]